MTCLTPEIGARTIAAERSVVDCGPAGPLDPHQVSS
jgi:hypothetical protein